MEKAKHTPGPWVIIGDHQDDRDVFANDELVATAYDVSHIEGDSRANARLIAAAPELLAALKALEEQVADLRAGRTWDADYIGLKQAHLKAKVAIQKAEGR